MPDTEFDRINGHRPAKIIEMLRVIDASARSNKASPEAVRALLQPVYDKLGADTPHDTASAATATPEPAPLPTRTGMDGELIAALRVLLRKHGEPAVTRALAWTGAHEKLKGE